MKTTFYWLFVFLNKIGLAGLFIWGFMFLLNVGEDVHYSFSLKTYFFWSLFLYLGTRFLLYIYKNDTKG